MTTTELIGKLREHWVGTDDVGKADGIVTDCTLAGDLAAWRAI